MKTQTRTTTKQVLAIFGLIVAMAIYMNPLSIENSLQSNPMIVTISNLPVILFCIFFMHTIQVLSKDEAECQKNYYYEGTANGTAFLVAIVSIILGLAVGVTSIIFSELIPLQWLGLFTYTLFKK